MEKLVGYKKYPEDAISVDDIVTQKEGLVRLYSFLHQGADFHKLANFVLDTSSKRAHIWRNGDQGYSYYLGGHNKFLHLKVPRELVGSIGNAISANFFMLERGNKPYFWLNFYSTDQAEDPFSSGRLDPREPINKIYFSGWHGVEEELIADFILGNNGITFEDLRPIAIQGKNRASLAKYRIGGKASLALNLYENPLLEEGDRLRLVPQEDGQRRYQWLDVIKTVGNETLDKDQRISSYRILRDRKRLTTQNWYGYERQLLIDYLTCQPGIRFDNLRPIRSKMLSKLEYVSIIHARNTSGLNLEIYPPQGSILPGEEVEIVPAQDEQKLYQWMDLYKTDAETGERLGEPITSVRMVEGKFQKHEWSGPERELLREYTEGKLAFSNLRPIPLVIGHGKDLIYLWKEKERRIYLVMSQHFKLQEGEKLTLIPEEEAKEGVTFLLKRGETSLMRYQWIQREKKFKIINNFSVNGETLLTYHPEDNVYIDPTGKRWIKREEVAKKYNISNIYISRLIQGAESIRYQHQSTAITLYNEGDILNLAGQQGLETLENWQQKIIMGNDTPVWILEHSENKWISGTELRHVFLNKGISAKKLKRVLSDVVSRSVRAKSGRIITVFDLQQILEKPEVKQALNLLVTDKATGILTDKQGQWIPFSGICRKYQVPAGTIKSRVFLDRVDQRLGLHRGHRVVLYNLGELENLPEFQLYLKNRTNRVEVKKHGSKPQIDWDNMTVNGKIVFIEKQAQIILESSNNLNSKVIKEGEYSNLLWGIFKYYPGKLRGLQKKMVVQQNKKDETLNIELISPYGEKGRVHWNYFEKNPNELAVFIETEAIKFIQGGGVLNITALNSAGLRSLAYGIVTYYSGGIEVLQQKIKEQIRVIETRSFTLDENGLPMDSKGKIWWSYLAQNNRELLYRVMEDQVKKFVEAGNHFNQKNLKKSGMSGFGAAITNYYPGGSQGIRQKLGLSMNKTQKPQDYWTLEMIEQETEGFIKIAGGLSDSLLKRYKRFDLAFAIRSKYPGKLHALRTKFGVIEAEAVFIPPGEADKVLLEFFENVE